ncbi:hypothetical protein, partial [Caulobacter sp. 3R27C2-B]|uniref:hypothetical protein n=1 Tax=Caulobacter sp. 3R27C2-B TaxID=2502219 RepID=UPI001BB1FC0C
IRSSTSRRSGHQSLKDRGSTLDAYLPEKGVSFASRNTVALTLTKFSHGGVTLVGQFQKQCHLPSQATVAQ